MIQLMTSGGLSGWVSSPTTLWRVGNDLLVRIHLDAAAGVFSTLGAKRNDHTDLNTGGGGGNCHGETALNHLDH